MGPSSFNFSPGLTGHVKWARVSGRSEQWLLLVLLLLFVVTQLPQGVMSWNSPNRYRKPKAQMGERL
mgnify:CR=1 FL=1